MHASVGLRSFVERLIFSVKVVGNSTDEYVNMKLKCPDTHDVKLRYAAQKRSPCSPNARDEGLRCFYSHSYRRRYGKY